MEKKLFALFFFLVCGGEFILLYLYKCRDDESNDVCVCAHIHTHEKKNTFIYIECYSMRSQLLVRDARRWCLRILELNRKISICVIFFN